MSQNVSTAVMQRRVEAPDSLDFFPTPPWATRALCEHVLIGHGWRREDLTEAYPLQWPIGRPRVNRRERSRFNVSLAKARDKLFNELRLMGAKLPVLSTNINLRRDGLPYANQPEPDDPGVAIYFGWKGKQVAFACDRWDRVRDNVQAVCHTIEALRGINRWGTGDMVEAAFSGFEALPAPGMVTPRPWWSVLGFSSNDVALARGREFIEGIYRQKAKDVHPDTGGSNDQMSELNAAISQARKELET